MDWASKLKQSRERQAAGGRPLAIGMYGKGGMGKTSLARQFGNPGFLVDKLEIGGIETLVKFGGIPPTDLLDFGTYTDLMGATRWLIDSPEHDAIVVDTVGGVDSVVNEHVLLSQFNNDRVKFTNFSEGERAAIHFFNDWIKLLDQARDAGKRVILLMHRARTSEGNTQGADYIQYIPDCNKRSFHRLIGWLDLLVYLDEVIVVDDKGLQGKVKKTGQRVIRTKGSGYEVKCRMGLPETIDMGEDAEQAYNNFNAAMGAARKQQGALVNG